MKFYLIFLIQVFITVEGWSCVFPVTKVFKRVNTKAVLQFDLSGYINQQTVGIVSVMFHDNTVRAAIKFNTGVITYSKVSGVNVSADLSGHVVFTIENVKAEDAGIYYITSKSTPTKCSCLYILGTPTRTAISVDNPSVGGRATLFCKSSSTTTPSNHSLGLIYSWRVDNIDNPSGPRYTYSTSRDKLTLSDIVKEDANKQFTCTATEDVTGGYTSSRSDSMSLNVLYGPDMAEINVKSPYTVTEGEVLKDIRCSSDCNPGCSYSWINVTSGSVISSDAVLSLTNVTRYMAGIYKCTVSNTAASVNTKSAENSTTVIVTLEGWQCMSPVTKVFKRVDTEAILNFDLSGYINRQTAITLNVKYHDNSPRAAIRYNSGAITYSTLSGVNVTADLSGNIVFTILNVEAEDAGIYYITSKSTPTKCSCLYILGTPTKPSVSVDNPSVGGRATLSCRSTSTTTPSNHSLGLIYSWRVDNIENPSGSRYTYSTNKDTLTLSNIVKEDAYKQFTCTATEDISGGYTSSPSDTMSLNVLYGPDMAEISVNSPYTVTEGEMPEDISCSSDCYPGCSYSWVNVTSGTEISSDAVLSLGTMTRYMAGIYKCTVSNTAASVYTKSSKNSTTVIVRYAPDVSVAISPLNTTEGANITLFCIGHGVPSEYHYTGLSQTVNGIEIPNSNKELIGTQRYSSIHFSSLRLEDTGIYTCKLNNEVADISDKLDQTGSINVTVKVLPKVLTDELQFAGVIGGTVHIKVPIYSFPELDTVSVTRYDGVDITEDNKHNFSTPSATVLTDFYGKSVTLNGAVFEMTIINLAEDNFGNYTLEISNKHDSTVVHIVIIGEGPPSPPKSFQFLSNHKKPTFIWEKNFNGGKDQHFIIQTSSPGTDQWINNTVIKETDKRYKINATFYLVQIELESGTYNARIIASNVKGESDAVNLGYTFDISSEEGPKPLPVGAIAGGIVSALAVIAVVAAVVVVVLRRKMGYKETVNQRNPQANELPPTDKDLAMKKKQSAEVDVEYAVVDRNAKTGKKECETYAIAQDSTSAKAKKKKHRKKNPNADGRSNIQKTVNKDGLLYADLDFCDQPKATRNFADHDLDNTTTYIEVDFSKKVNPLPPSDEEDNTKH